MSIYCCNFHRYIKSNMTFRFHFSRFKDFFLVIFIFIRIQDYCLPSTSCFLHCKHVLFIESEVHTRVLMTTVLPSKEFNLFSWNTSFNVRGMSGTELFLLIKTFSFPLTVLHAIDVGIWSVINRIFSEWILTTIISDGSRTKHSFCLRALPPVRLPKLQKKSISHISSKWDY